MDLPNKLDDLWQDWTGKTLEQKLAVFQEVKRREGKVIFSNQDVDNLLERALEVGKALKLNPNAKAAFSTPNKKWLAAHDPNSQRARAQGRNQARLQTLNEPMATPKLNVPKDGNWWTPRIKKQQE